MLPGVKLLTSQSARETQNPPEASYKSGHVIFLILGTYCHAVTLLLRTSLQQVQLFFWRKPSITFSVPVLSASVDCFKIRLVLKPMSCELWIIGGSPRVGGKVGELIWSVLLLLNNISIFHWIRIRYNNELNHTSCIIVSKIVDLLHFTQFPSQAIGVTQYCPSPVCSACGNQVTGTSACLAFFFALSHDSSQFWIKQTQRQYLNKTELLQSQSLGPSY